MLVRHLFFSCYLFFSLNSLLGQSDTQYWYFGYNAGIKFTKSNYQVDTKGQINTGEGTRSIDLGDGVFFYSDGESIFNKNHHKIKGISLRGEPSSTQAAMFIKHEDNDSIIFLLTNSTSTTAGTDCPSFYYELKIENDTSLQLKQGFSLNQFGSEKTSSILHKNCRDIWIVSHKFTGIEYYTYLINKNGLIQCKTSSLLGSNYKTSSNPGQGQIKFSTNGNYIAASSSALGKVDLFHFDNSSGKLSSPIILDIFFNHGIEFSLNERYLYVTNIQGKLFQYDLTIWDSASIKATEKTITSQGVKTISPLQMCTNGKIYWSHNDSGYLAVINDPDSSGNKCNFTFRGIYLNGKKSAGGVPAFNQSYFYTPAINYSYEMECIGNSVKFWGNDTFSANTHNWQVRKLAIGTWQSVSNSKSFTYAFADTGRYDIRYIAGNGTKRDTVIKTITIYPKINKQFLGKDTTYTTGSSINKILKTPNGMHCHLWLNDSSGLSTFTADTTGIYIYAK
ncbi:MAG: hypothetical protein PSX81_10425 [bacterium]|nr:hypothetical protein [bacterium]